MNKSLGLAAAAALVVGAVSVSPASAHGGHHHHPGGRHGHVHRGHGGHHPHWGGGRHGPHGHGWYRGGPVIVRGGLGITIDRRPIIVEGPRRVVVAGAYPVYGRPAGDGPGCTTARRVGPAPWGWHTIVTTRTCIVP